MQQFSLNIPINPVSYGNTSISIAREIYQRGLSPCIFPIGQPDLGAQKKDPDFELWLQSCINKSFKMHKRTYPTIKLWHENQIMDGLSDKRLSIVFHETDQITDVEKNILEQQDVAFTTSKFTKEVYEESGLTNIQYLPLGFDSHNFFEKPRKPSDKIVFTLNGKREVRKATDRIVKAWVKRFGNNQDYQLTLAIFNPFFRTPDGRPLSPDEQKAMFVQQVLDGKTIWNINFIPWMNTLAEVNSAYNFTDIDLSGLSLCEGFNIPLFTHLCLGKHAVVLDAHVHKDFCNADNAVLVEPTGKVKAVDGMFFHEGTPFLQGNWFDWSEDAAIAGMEQAVAKFRSNPVNEGGRDLKKTFTWEKTVNTLFASL